MSWAAPLMALAGWMIVTDVHLRSPLRRRPRVSKQTSSGQIARALLIGCAGGLNLTGALQLAARSAQTADRIQIEALLRRARPSGLGAALAATNEGSLANLWLCLARAQMTGAALVPTLRSFVDSVSSEQRNDMLRRARTLPIRLVPAVSLLLLPGFVLVVMGPAMVDGASDLLGFVVP